MQGNCGYQMYRGFHNIPCDLRVRYGMSRYGYGVGKPDPWVARSKP